MKKLSTFLALTTLAFVGTLLSTSACDGSDSTVEVCVDAADCSTDGDICSGGQCLPAECNDDVDCDLSVTGDAFSKDELDAGNDECEDEAFVTILGFDGGELCATGADAGVCGEGFDVVDADAPGGGTVEVCVSGGGSCTEGSCG